MAGLWKLPMIYVCENNHYGMGTTAERAAHNTNFHERGDKIPGVKIEAQNVLMVREAFKWAGAYVIENGPLFMELNTYRYHGHSMSDPGVTYRTKEEIQGVRATRDPVEIARNYLLDNNMATAAETKDIEKAIRKRIEGEVEQIRKDPFPPMSELYADIGVTKEHYVRGVEYSLTKHID